MKHKEHVFKVNKGIVTVYSNYCKGCGLCIVKCPMEAIQWGVFLGVYGTPAVEINREKCNLCGQCSLVCPECAVDVVYVPRSKREWLRFV